jgi:hypothetical protein
MKMGGGRQKLLFPDWKQLLQSKNKTLYSENYTLLMAAYYYLFLFSLALQPSAGCGLLVSQGFVITHDAPQSVGLLWTSVQLVAETST